MLKFRIKSLDGLSPELIALYTKDGDGYVLNVEGAVPREKLDEFRNNNVELKRKLDEFNGVDPAKYKTLLDLETKFNEKKLIDTAGLDAAVKDRVGRLQEEHAAALKTATDQNQVMTRQLESLLIDSAVRTAANTAAVLSTAVDDVLLRAKSTFKIVDGVAVATDPDGHTIYGVDGVKPLTIGDWTKGLAKQAPHLFAGNNGGGAPGGGLPGQDTSKMSATSKISAGLAVG
jgi:hypothetical protein